MSRKLNALRGDKAALKALIGQLADASASAETGVAGLRVAAGDIDRVLEKKLEEAQSLRDDLAYMIERGGAAADRLEGTIRARREAPKAETPRQVEPERPRSAPPAQPSRNDSSAAAAKFVEQMAARLAPPAPSRAERQLLRALGGRR